MATNIVIKKLEDKTFDDYVEAEKRLNELGINSDINSDLYKLLANKVRGACPCYCYLSTDKRLKVEVKRNYIYYKKIENTYGDGFVTSMIHDVSAEAEGVGYIEKGNKNCIINTNSHFIKYGLSNDNQATWDTTACPEEWIESQTPFSFRLNDDCSLIIFDCNPSLKGKAYDSYNGATDTTCREYDQIPVVDNFETVATKEVKFIDAKNSSYPIGTMSISYKYYDNYKNQTGSDSFEETTIECESLVNVIITDDQETFSSYNELYSKLNDTLK